MSKDIVQGNKPTYTLKPGLSGKLSEITIKLLLAQKAMLKKINSNSDKILNKKFTV